MFARSTVLSNWGAADRLGDAPVLFGASRANQGWSVMMARTERLASWLRAALLLLVVASASAWVAPARAGGEPTGPSKALFDEGRAALERGDYALACQKFAESQLAEARVGTLLNLALCYEKRAMLVQAHETWRGAQGLASELGDDRADVARKRADEMLPRVPLLTLTLEASAPAGTTVRWTDSYQTEPKLVGDGEFGKPFPVNAGTVRLLVEAPGRQARTHELAVAEYDRTKFVVAVGPLVATDLGPPGDKPAPPVGQRAPPPPAVDRAESTSPWTVTGFVIGGVGIVGLSLGAVFGGLAMSKQSESDCNKDSVCDTQAGVDLQEQAIDMATASTVAFVIGGTLTAAGIVMILAAPDPSTPAGDQSAISTAKLSMHPTGASLALEF